MGEILIFQIPQRNSGKINKQLPGLKKNENQNIKLKKFNAILQHANAIDKR